MKNKKLLGAMFSAAFLNATSAAWAAEDVVDVERFQPPIVNQIVPTQQHSWNIPDSVRAARVAGLNAIVPSYNGKGNLIASWNPRVGRVSDTSYVHHPARWSRSEPCQL